MRDAGPADPANTRSVNYGANENKAVGANVFNGNNANEIPAFIRITAIHGKNAGSSHGLMTLENGEEIVVGQVISRADFERIFWNASKSDGSFSFVPVQDAQGTTAPNTVEQTVVIKTPDPLAPGSNPGTSSGEGGNTGHEAGSQTGAGSGTGSSTGNGANTGANAGTGTANNGTGPNNTTGQQSGNDKGDGTAQHTGSPSGTGEASNQSASSGDGAAPAGGKPGAEGSGSENKPVTGSGSDSTSGSASGSGSAGGSGSTSGSDRNNGSGSDKGGSTPSEGQSSQASNGQAPSQNTAGQGSESQPPAQTPGSQGSSEQTTSPTQGSPSSEQTPPQNAGGGSGTGTPGAGESTQTGGAQTGGAQTGTSETESSGTGDNGKQNGDGDAKHEGDGAEGDGTKGEDTKGEDGEQGKNGEDTASPSNPPTTTSPPTPPDYAPNQSVQQAIHANNKPVGASIFNGTNPAHAPSFVKITAVLDKDGGEVSDAMTLGKEGEAITTDQVISKEQFDNVFLDALKAPGGSFKFIPVMDSEGTEMPGATEQTVSIGFDYVYHFSKQPFLDAIEGEERFSHYKVHLITEHQDTNNTLDGMFKLDGDQRTPLKVGDLIRPEDFDKLYWDYTSNNGGRFELAGLDSQGQEISNEEHLQLYMADYAKTRTGKVPPEEPGGEETDVEDSEDSNDIAGHSAALHPESFTDAASAFHGSSHLSVNGQSTLDNLLEHQVIHGIL